MPLHTKHAMLPDTLVSTPQHPVPAVTTYPLVPGERRAVPMSSSSEGAHEGDKLLSSTALTPHDSFLLRWSISDWIVTFVIIAFGLWADKAVPFSRQIGPQANDPLISYTHTPNALAQVPTSRLFSIAFYIPLGVLIVIIVVCAPARFGEANGFRRLTLHITDV